LKNANRIVEISLVLVGFGMKKQCGDELRWKTAPKQL